MTTTHAVGGIRRADGGRFLAGITYPSVTGDGFISGANLRANRIHHESGSAQSHYANY